MYVLVKFGVCQYLRWFITGEKKQIELLKGNVFCCIHKIICEIDYFVFVLKQFRKIGYAAVLK